MEQAVLHGARRPARLQERDATAPTAVDQRVFAQLVPPAHALRQGKRRSDCARWRALVTAGDRPAMGRTAADPGRVRQRRWLQVPSPRAERAGMATAQGQVAWRDVRDLALPRRRPVPSRRAAPRA